MRAWMLIGIHLGNEIAYLLDLATDGGLEYIDSSCSSFWVITLELFQDLTLDILDKSSQHRFLTFGQSSNDGMLFWHLIKI